MGRRVNVIGVGMVPFQKPGKSEEYHVMAAAAAKTALKDAGVDYNEIEQAYAGYVYGGSTCGQRAIYDVRTRVYRHIQNQPLGFFFCSTAVSRTRTHSFHLLSASPHVSQR